MKKEIISTLLLASLLGACSSDKHVSTNEIRTVDVRSAMEKESPFSMKEDVESIEYIPLETTDSCLISNTSSLIADDNYIFFVKWQDKPSLSIQPKREVHPTNRACGRRPWRICSLFHIRALIEQFPKRNLSQPKKSSGLSLCLRRHFSTG